MPKSENPTPDVPHIVCDCPLAAVAESLFIESLSDPRFLQYLNVVAAVSSTTTSKIAAVACIVNACDMLAAAKVPDDSDDIRAQLDDQDVDVLCHLVERCVSLVNDRSSKGCDPNHLAEFIEYSVNAPEGGQG